MPLPPYVEEKAVTGLVVLAPFNNATVGATFGVDGSYTTNGATISITAEDSSEPKKTFGPFTCLVVEEAWSVTVVINASITNSITLTITASDVLTDFNSLIANISSTVDTAGDAGAVEDP